MKPEDDELMRRIQAGDSRAMDLLVSRYHRRLFCFAYRMLGRREAAEDVAQETFLRVYRHASRYREGGRFSAWLFAIAANLCRTEIRRRARHPELAWDECKHVQAPGSVEDLAMHHLEQEEVRQALGRLSPDHQMAVALFYFEGMTYQEIADACGCALGTVKSRLHYALNCLRRALPAVVEERSSGGRSGQ